MKGTIIDFLKLASENENLGRELAELAAKYDFEFIPPEELSEDELGKVAGGVISQVESVKGGNTDLLSSLSSVLAELRNQPSPPPPEPTDPNTTLTAGSIEKVK